MTPEGPRTTTASSFAVAALRANSLSAAPTNAGKYCCCCCVEEDEDEPLLVCLSLFPSSSRKKVFVGDHRFPLELLAVGELWR